MDPDDDIGTTSVDVEETNAGVQDRNNGSTSMDMDETNDEVGERNTNAAHQQDLQQRNEQLLQERDSFQSQLSDARQEHMALKARNQTMQETIRSGDTEASRLRLENDALKEKVAALEARDPIDKQPLVDQLEADKFRLQNDRKLLIKKLNKLKQKLQQPQNSEDQNEIELPSVSSIVSKESILSMLQDQHLHSRWQQRDDEAFEIFLATSNYEDGSIKGTSCTIDRNDVVAYPAIAALVEGVKAYLDEEPRAINIYGKYLASITPSYLFSSCQMNRTIFVGKEEVLETYIHSEAPHVIRGNEIVQVGQLSEYGERKKRRLSDVQAWQLVTTEQGNT
jgi:predicted nuclease with TOPRIM domain